MANKFTRFLTGVFQGATNPKGIVSDYKHATRLFIDDTFRLAPRTKFNFYVRFEIDKSAIKAPKFGNNEIEEFGLLVKNTDLPGFTFDIETKHQYNRKKLLYTKINYDPVNINFHDDSAGVTNALWAIYYGYYIADRKSASVTTPGSDTSFGYEANQYRNTGTPKDGFRYGLDNEISSDVFKSITIYTMSRRRFLSYTLVNPKIQSWKHDNFDHTLGAEVAQNAMAVQYESVIYGGGRVLENSPKGFASLHYDQTPSPLSVAGGGVSSLLGEGGVLDGMEQVFGAISDGTAFSSPAGFLSTTIKAINTYKNADRLSTESIASEAINILSNPSTSQAVSGVLGVVLPKNTQGTGDVKASPKKLAPGS